MQADFPEALEFLFRPSRYKVAYGGRGSAKSWSFARALLLQGVSRQKQILCAREIQKSIADSVHRLLWTQIDSLNLNAFYEVQNNRILGRNGTEVTFAGLKHNINNIKSVEGTDIAWIEEAQTVSKASWDVLIPTIRKPESEIWISFNPELATDPTYLRFVQDPPTNSVVRKVNWSDNPWFSDVLKAEMEDMRVRDPDGFLTTWEGHCRQTLSGAIYADQIRAATANNQFTRVPVVEGKPIHTAWDLGRADMTSIWFWQTVGFEHRVVDFFEDRGKPLSHYMKALRQKGYLYGTCHLPHDARNELLAADKTIEQQMRDAGFTVQIVPKLGIAAGISATRDLFPRLYFDQEKCADGLNQLRRYRYGVDETTGQFTREPLHDSASHASDALRYMSISITETGTSAWDRPIRADIGWVA